MGYYGISFNFNCPNCESIISGKIKVDENGLDITNANVTEVGDWGEYYTVELPVVFPIFVHTYLDDGQEEQIFEYLEKYLELPNTNKKIKQQKKEVKRILYELRRTKKIGWIED